jgi:plasmid stabilization system protein ParE
MAYKVQVSDTAEGEIDGILTYLVDELKSPDAARSFYDDVLKCYRVLEENPYIYSLCLDEMLARQGYRRAVIKNYIIVYQIAEDEPLVKVISVVHGSRDYANLL